MAEEKQEPAEIPNPWLDNIHQEAKQKAEEISQLLKTPVVPFVFVVEDGKDSAVGFFRKPDAKTGFKIMRQSLEDPEGAVQMIARANLVRDKDMEALGFQGKTSDPRFMDVNGNYDMEHSGINTSLLLRASSMIDVHVDTLKKKLKPQGS